MALSRARASRLRLHRITRLQVLAATAVSENCLLCLAGSILVFVAYQFRCLVRFALCGRDRLRMWLMGPIFSTYAALCRGGHGLSVVVVVGETITVRANE